METVKEEFLLSAIFIGKWLLLGLGIIGLVYMAISLAYNKSYYEPQIKKIRLSNSTARGEQVCRSVRS